MAEHPRLAALLEAQMPEPGMYATSLRGVSLIRADEPIAREPLLYQPRIIVVAQGRKRLWLGEESFDYDTDNYLVLAVPMPMECATMPVDGKPLLAMTIEIDPILVGELMLEIDDHTAVAEQPSFVASTTVTADVIDAATRLAETLGSGIRTRVLGPQIVREIVFDVLQGKRGDVLRMLAGNSGRHGQLARVLRHINEDYALDLDVPTLARGANMSVSTFHQAFRDMTATSPLQYIKQTRLHKARALLVDEEITAQEAARRVGYASASQFGREYRRMFGVSPAADRAALSA